MTPDNDLNAKLDSVRGMRFLNLPVQLNERHDRVAVPIHPEKCFDQKLNIG